MLKGSGKYKLQRTGTDTSGFYQCIGMDHRAQSSLSENKVIKKRLVDHFIINVGGGNLGYDLRPQLSNSLMLRQPTGLNSQDVFYDEKSQIPLDISCEMH